MTTGLTLTRPVPELVEKRVELQAAQQRQAGTALAAGPTQRQSVPEQRQRTSQVPSRELHTHHAQQSVRLNAMSEQSVKRSQLERGEKHFSLKIVGEEHLICVPVLYIRLIIGQL